ncbi:MAG TPA: hypothetical protein EYP30_07085 [Archaeoglobaceae archaeon]|nr:hypothetical protein [Archaeoglobaceae archaeon]
MKAKLYIEEVKIEKYMQFRNDVRYKKYFRIIDDANKILPEIPIPENPVSVDTGYIEVGEPDRYSPVIVTGNSLYTHTVIGFILTESETDCHLLSADTDGYTVDMAVYLGIFNAERVKDVIDETDISSKINHNQIIIPGFASKMKEEVEVLTGWRTIVGPVCAVELPIFIATQWR